MTGINITAEMKASAIKYKKELTTLIRFYFDEIKKDNGFHHKSGIYGTEKAGMLTVNGKMGPYNAEDAILATYGIIIEEITTYHGKNYEKIEIAELEETLWGQGIVTAEDWKKSELGKKILADWVLANLESVVENLWVATRKPDGKQTIDLFDGIDTQIVKAIADGKLSAEKKNLSQLTEVLDETNAMDVLLAQWRNLPKKLRKQKLKMHVSEDVYNAYCDAYRLERGNLHDKDQDQQVLFGTRKRVTIVPQMHRESDSPIIWTVDKNITIGTGSRGTKERYEVEKDNNLAFIQFLHEMFFGTAIACYHESFFHVTKLASAGE